MATLKEQVWLEEYLSCWNATEAARRAKYKWPRRVGSQKLAKFAGEIEQRVDELTMSADEALARLAEIARGAWAEYIQGDGSIDIHQMVEDSKAHLISKVADTQYGRRIEFCDMQSALEKIGRVHGLFVDKQEVTLKGGVDIHVVYDEG